MQAIFVMIKCDLGKTYDVANHIADHIEETSELYSVSGQHDLLAKFYVKEGDDIGQFICDRLQATPHIKETFTLNTFNAFVV